MTGTVYKLKQHLMAVVFLQVLFLFCIFGYLVILIFYKWIAVNVNSPHVSN